MTISYTLPFTLAIVLLIGALVACLTLLSRERRRADRQTRRLSEEQARMMAGMERALDENARRVTDSAREMAERQDRLRDAIDARIDAMQSSNERRLNEMRLTVDKRLADSLTQSFGAVDKRLSEVDRSLGEVHALIGEFDGMKRLLGGVKTRGIWGELQLRTLLEDILPPDQYIENAAIPEGGQSRVEFAVRLCGDDRDSLLPIDSKFPQEDYLRLADAEQAGNAELLPELRTRLARALREQAKRISEKYIRPPQTEEFAVMFLPTESLYAEAARQPGLIEELQRTYRVLIAGPTTLAALLTGLRAANAGAALRRRSGEVLGLLRRTEDELKSCRESIGQARTRLTQAQEAVDRLDARTQRLERTLGGMRTLEEPSDPQ